jgi:hypothetical protein
MLVERRNIGPIDKMSWHFPLAVFRNRGAATKIRVCSRNLSGLPQHGIGSVSIRGGVGRRHNVWVSRYEVWDVRHKGGVWRHKSSGACTQDIGCDTNLYEKLYIYILELGGVHNLN